MRADIVENRTLKANCRGSWATVCSFSADQTDRIKTAAEQLVLGAAGRVSFKICDEKNLTLAALDARREPVGWSDRE